MKQREEVYLSGYLQTTNSQEKYCGSAQQKGNKNLKRKPKLTAMNAIKRLDKTKMFSADETSELKVPVWF